MRDPEDFDGVEATGHRVPSITDMEAPEADAFEQVLSAAPDGVADVLDVSADREAPEADLLEQARIVTFDEE